MNKYTLTILALLCILAILEVQDKPKEFTFDVATLDTPKLVKNDPVIEVVEAKPVQSDKVPVQPKKTAPAVKKQSNPVVSKKETVAPPPKDPQRIIKKGWPATDEIQNIVNYAYKKGGKDFLLTLEWENGLWKWDRRSGVVGANGYYDYGICQLNGQWHGKFIFANGYNLKAGFSKDFQSPYKQIDYCFGVWKDAIAKNRIKTTFYAYNVRHTKAVRFQNLK